MGDSRAIMVECAGPTETGESRASNFSESEKEQTLSKTIFDEGENLKESKGSPNEKTKFLKICVNKPLIPLNIALFCWFGGAVAMTTFGTLYLKQLGLSLDKFSVIFVILPFIQFFGKLVSGIVADKIGRSKPVLQANLLLTLLAANGMLFIPGLKEKPCIGTLIDCNVLQTANDVSMTERCIVQADDSFIATCTFHCSRELSFHIEDICFQIYISECDLLAQKGIHHNLTFPEYILSNETATAIAKHYTVYDNNGINNNNLCLIPLVNNCTSACERNINTSSEKTHCKSPEGDIRLFVLSFILYTLFGTFMSNVFSIFDVTTMSIVKAHDSEFGRQRIWAIVSAIIAPSLTGYVISAVSPENGPQKYNVAFYAFDAMVIITMVTVWKLEVAIDPPAQHMLRKTITLLKSVDILVFVIIIFVSGTAWSFIWYFLPWYLEELGASSMLIGLTIAFGDLLALPFLFTSGWFVKKVGNMNLMVLSLVGYVARFIGYSFVINPWWAIIIQPLEVLNYHLLWVAVVTYSHTAAPPGLTATVIATAGGFHFGLGKGSSGLIGGMIMSMYGGKMAFRVMGAICATAAALYALFLYIRRKYRT